MGTSEVETCNEKTVAPTAPCGKDIKQDMTDDDVQSKTLGMRIQGKIASKMSSKALAKQVVDGPTSELIDNCYRIAKLYLGNKKDAEKVMKNMIKIIVKVAILSRNDVFTQDELVHVQNFQKQFQKIAKTIISFYEVDFTFDGDFMVSLIQDSKDMLKAIVRNHLTEKSINRIDSVYAVYADITLLETAFQPDSQYRVYLGNVVTSMNTLIEAGEL